MSTEVPFNEDRLTRSEAAKYLGLENPGTLAVWACRGFPSIPYVKVGSRVFSRRSELDAFIESRTIRTSKKKGRP